jgi:DNA-binding transcriptional MerR regulator
MFKIGDFSRLSQVTVKALRYYDEIGLLKPSEVDRFTGYRYYSANQLPRLHRILALKDLGLSLEQVGTLLDEGLTAEQIRGMLRLKHAEIRQQADEVKERLARVETWLSQIEQEGKMPAQEVVIKQVKPVKVAALRDTVANYGAQGPLWEELMGFIVQHGARPSGPCFAVYYDPEYRERDVDLEVCQPVDRALPDDPRVKVHEIPGAETMACVVHQGSYDRFMETYGALTAWIEANGYQIVGPNREIYLVSMNDTSDASALVTEIQLPVARV